MTYQATTNSTRTPYSRPVFGALYKRKKMGPTYRPRPRPRQRPSIERQPTGRSGRRQITRF